MTLTQFLTQFGNLKKDSDTEIDLDQMIWVLIQETTISDKFFLLLLGFVITST